MRNHRLAVLSLSAIAVLLLAPLGAVAPSPSYAAGETCDGKPATIVISAEPDAEEFGTPGDDVVVITTSDVFMFDAGDGDDTVCAGPGTTFIYGGNGNDTIDLGALTQPDYVDTGPGDDTVIGGPASDSIVGGDGDDALDGGAGSDGVSGGSGDDHVLGGEGDDTVTGGDDGALPGIDVVDGGPGDDLVDDTSSDETLTGGTGDDELAMSDPSSDDPETCYGHGDNNLVLSVADHTVTGLGTDTFDGFERYHGGMYTETFIGGPGPDHFEDHYCGRTTMLGRGGDDTLISHSCGAHDNGGPGNDSLTFDQIGSGTFSGGRGNDRLTLAWSDDYGCTGRPSFTRRTAAGGPGEDWLMVSSYLADEVRRVDLHRGVAGPRNIQVALAGIENAQQLVGPQPSPAKLRLVGTDGPNILIGGDGPTTIFGRQGNDVLRGGLGHDVIYGGTGHDRCRAEVRHECEAR